MLVAVFIIFIIGGEIIRRKAVGTVGNYIFVSIFYLQQKGDKF